MKAVIIHQYGSADVLEIVDLPTPEPEDDQILVKVHFAAANPKDIFIRKGRFKALTGNAFPLQLGYDFSGEIIKCGQNIHHFKAGDNVYGMVDGWRGGAHAEYVLVNAEEIAHTPPSLSHHDAAAVPLAALTALQALRNSGQIKSGHHVCINGASGGVGTFAIQIAKEFGAEVTAVCSHRNTELVTSLGADHIWDYTQDDIAKSTGRYDIFFDVFGNQSFMHIRHLLKSRGTYVTTVPKFANFIHIALTRFWPGKKARLVVVKPSTDDLDQISNMIEDGKVKPCIETTYQLDEIKQVHLHLQSKRTKGKVVIQI